MGTKIKVSVIMPVMNVEKYLRESIDSALSQSLQDIEIICIDDGSTDSSGDILDEYAGKDSRIRVLHKKNTGYGNSMNIGMDMANGEFIAILEPDDFIASDMYQSLYQVASENTLDIVRSDFSIVEGEKGDYSYTPTKVWWQKEFYDRILTKNERKELYKAWIAHWTALYRRSFLVKNQIRYNETPGASYQDTGFWFQTLALADRMMLHDGNFYRYRVDNPGSSMNNHKKVNCIIKEYDFVQEQLEKRGLLKEYLPQYTMLRYISHRDTALRVADEFKSEFVIAAADVFRLMEKANLVDDSAMEESDKKKFYLWMEDPETYLEELTKATRVLEEHLSVYDGFYIYGAGARGKRMFMRLSDSCKKKFKGFVVTRKDFEGQRVYARPVFSIEELSAEPHIAFLIGVTKRYDSEIREILQSRDFTNIVSISEEIV